jgi:hypothetical protein
MVRVSTLNAKMVDLELKADTMAQSVTAEDFRRIALSLPEATESSHMEHPDFRVRKRIFATLGYPDNKCGMVNLQPDQQKTFSRDYPDAFVPVKGGWGRIGATQVRLDCVEKATLREAITTAYENVALKRTARKKV